jgi:hypothetical protein
MALKVTENNPKRMLQGNLMQSTNIYQCRYLLEVYKSPNPFSYISYTCADFRIAVTDSVSVPKFSMFDDLIYVSQHQPAPVARVLQGTPVTDSRIQNFKTGAFAVTVKDPAIDLKTINFKVSGNNGTDSTKSLADLMKAPPATTSSNFWFWFFIILAIIAIGVVGFFVYKHMSSGVEDPKAGYTKDVDNSRPSDLDDTKL